MAENKDQYAVEISTPADTSGLEKTVAGAEAITPAAEKAAESLDKVATSTEKIQPPAEKDWFVDVIDQATAARREVEGFEDKLRNITATELEVVKLQFEAGRDAALAAGEATEEYEKKIAAVVLVQQEQAAAARESAEATQDVADANQDAGVSALDTASSIGTMSSAILDGTKGAKGFSLVIRSLAYLLTGNFSGAIKAASAAIKGLRLLVATSPFGLWVAGITALVTGIVLLVKKMGETESATVKLAKALETPESRLTRLAEAIDKVNKARLDGAVAEAKKLADEYARSTNELKEQRRIQDQSLNAEMAQQVEKNNLDRERELATTDDPQKQAEIRLKYATIELQIRQTFEKKQTAAAIARAKEDETNNAKAMEVVQAQIAAAQKPVTSAKEDFSASQKRLAELGVKSDQQILKDRLAALESGRVTTSAGTEEGRANIAEMRNLRGLRARGDLDTAPTWNGAQEQLKKQQEEQIKKVRDAQTGTFANPYDPAREKAALLRQSQIQESIDLIGKLPVQEKAIETAADVAKKAVEDLTAKAKELEAQAATLAAAVKLAETHGATTRIKQTGEVESLAQQSKTVHDSGIAAQESQNQKGIDAFNKLPPDQRLLQTIQPFITPYLQQGSSVPGTQSRKMMELIGGLKDGDQGGEMEELMRLWTEFIRLTVADRQSQKSQIERLSDQIKSATDEIREMNSRSRTSPTQ